MPTYKHVCKGEKKKVNFGYNNDKDVFKVEENTLLPYPNDPHQFFTKLSYLSEDWEILQKFIDIHNIEPTWKNCNYSWGSYDEDSGGWTGCIGKVRRSALLPRSSVSFIVISYCQ